MCRGEKYRRQEKPRVADREPHQEEQKGESPSPTESDKSNASDTAGFFRQSCQVFIKEAKLNDKDWRYILVMVNRFLETGDVPKELPEKLRHLSIPGLRELTSRFPSGPIPFHAGTELCNLNSYFTAQDNQNGAVLPPNALRWIAMGWLAVGVNVGRSLPQADLGRAVGLNETDQQELVRLRDEKLELYKANAELRVMVEQFLATAQTADKLLSSCKRRRL